jgi:hypothetical protein
VRLAGLGDCGDNPCGASDLLSPSTACASYVLCQGEQSLLSMPTGGLFTPNQVFYGGGVVAADAAQAVGQVGLDALKNIVAGGTGGDPTSTSNSLLTYALIGGGVLLTILILPELLRK